MNYSIFSNIAFSRTLAGSTASGFSTWGLVFLLGLMVPSGELSATTLGIVLGVRTVGFLFGVLFGGIWADQFSRRGVIWYASLISMFAIALIIFGLYQQVMLWLYVGAAIAGFGQGGCRPAYQALVPQVASAEQLQAANAWMGLSIRLVNLLGPALTSAMVLWGGSIPAFTLLFAMWAVSAFLPPWLESDRPIASDTSLEKPKTMAGIVADLQGGILEARKHPWFIWSLVALTLVIATGYSATNVILPIISEAAGGIALMAQCITLYTLGGALGAIVLSRFKPQQPGWFALAGMASYGFVPLSLLFNEHGWPPFTGYFLAGFGIEMFNVLWFSAIQREVPKTHLARVSSLDFLCSYGLAPLGLGLISPLSNYFGHATILFACGLICLCAPLLVMLVRSSKNYSNSPLISASHA